MSDAYNLDNYPQMIREFCRYKSGIQGRSEKTVNEYMLDLRMFCRYRYAKDNGMKTDDETLESIDISGFDTDFFAKITTEQIYDFIYYLRNSRGDGTASRARKLSAIKSFFKFHTQNVRTLSVNPAADIEGPKKAKSLPKYLSVDESLEFLNAVTETAPHGLRTRDYAIMTMFLNCGMRLSELAGISMSDVDSHFRSLRVIGKGAKERVIYLNDACRAALEAYLPDRMKLLQSGRGDGALFVSRRGDRISVKTVQATVKKYLAAAGLEYKHYSTHKLRHTAATLMYQSGQVDIRVLKDILGHEQLNTTQIYTHVSNKSMEDAMQTNPLAAVKPKTPRGTYGENKDE